MHYTDDLILTISDELRYFHWRIGGVITPRGVSKVLSGYFHERARSLPFEDRDARVHLKMCEIYVATKKLRKMQEIYQEVMEEMGLLEPVSEPEEAEKIEEAQALTDRIMEWVRAARARMRPAR